MRYVLETYFIAAATLRSGAAGGWLWLEPVRSHRVAAAAHVPGRDGGVVKYRIFSGRVGRRKLTRDFALPLHACDVDPQPQPQDNDAFCE